MKSRQDAGAIDRAGLRLKLRKAQAEAGDIVLVFADESEALTHPYPARSGQVVGKELPKMHPALSATFLRKMRR